MKINSHYKKGIISNLIRFFSKGKFNHSSIEINGFIYEAHIHTGVRKVPLALWDSSSVAASQTLKISSYREKQVIAWLDKQVGKKYDILGVLTFVWAIFDEKQGRWFCSELAYVAVMKAMGIDSKKVTYNQRVSPHELWSQINVLLKVI